MMTEHIDASSLPLTPKKEQNARNGNDSDTDPDDIDDLSSTSLLSFTVNNSILFDGPNNESHLTPMVRSAYLSYLHKCLLNNYATCYEQEDHEIPRTELKRCADQMELRAIRLALEVKLYRHNMLRMIQDIKSHTKRKKAYKKSIIFLKKSENKADMAVQTEHTCMDSYKINNIQHTHITSNSEKASQTTSLSSPIISNSYCESKSTVKDSDNETNIQMQLQAAINEESNDVDQQIKDQTDSQVTNDVIKNEDENSQDSLLQHMEDMFCESDDSSDLTKLIEKHSGVTKANIDKEISKICFGEDTIAGSNLCDISRSNNNISKPVARGNTKEGKISFSRYKEMQNRKAANQTGMNECEIIDFKQKQRLEAMWLVERVHQVSKLKAKMTELSLTNYRKYEKVKKKFIQLFGDSEEEEMMSDSPICIEEHLPACKERIAPWIVQYLMPFYKKRRIKNRQLFKAVAKYIADMLIIENTFPEQECVNRYIEHYFKNKKFISTKQDVYL